MKQKTALLIPALCLLTACSVGTPDPEPVNSIEQTQTSIEDIKQESEDEKIMEEKYTLAKNYKLRGESNPIMTQAYGADPFALVYGDTVYIYMTADAYEYDANGNIIENSYSKIKSIHVVSTKDFKNFEDHGEIPVAGTDGIAKWAHNSWAPAAAWKNIDGKDKFFLYFADNGGGIGVLSADSPVGPFEDPLGEALISRRTPTCDTVLWLFDPAVLVDDDGTGYIYFGGGVPEGKSDYPGTGRVAKLGADMISIDGTPVALDVPCLFEDSGIHKFGNKYYYTYCTNWSVPAESTKEFGFNNGEIACLVSDNPMGPFTYQGVVLENPGKLCGLYGNNHHAIFSFNDKYYIVYHSRMLEKKMGIEHGYRSTFINEVNIEPDGTIKRVIQTTQGPAQLVKVNPFVENKATCVSKMAGTNAVPSDDLGYGNMLLGEINAGDFIEVSGVNFDASPAFVTVTAKAPKGETAFVHVGFEIPGNKDIALIQILGTGEFETYKAPVTEVVSGEHFLYFVFNTSSEELVVKSWKFE